jgi:dihydrofolate reductase
MQKEIIVIVAVAKNNVIGKDNRMPWHNKEDLERFKSLTLNHTVIMGRKTFLSLPIKPLPRRENIVLSRNNFKFDNVIVKESLDEAINHSKNKMVFIIGGSSVYEESMKFANKLEITKIDKEYEGDTFFPEIDGSEWELIKEERKEYYSFQTYIRKQGESRNQI